MDIFSIFTLLGGLSFFLYGMTVMSNGLKKVAGGKLEKTLRKMTSNPLKGLILGAGITIAIQSSSALTVMLVGLVNSGIMQLSQTVGVIMGSNIGTTLTAWLFSLTGVESDNFFLKLLNPESFAPLVAFIGIAMNMLGKTDKKKAVGHIFVGFGVLMYGMTLMSGAVSPLRDMPQFAAILTMFTNPLLGVLIGTIITGIIQSSAASVGILQALSLTGSLNYAMALPIIMGQNIGTCVTSFLSCIGTNQNAKRVATVHIYFNLIGTIICLAVFYGTSMFITIPFMNSAIDPMGIAVVHSIFNIVTTLILFPFSRQLEKLACMTVREKEDTSEQYVFLDERLLLSPGLAISECESMTMKMSELARDTLLYSIRLLWNCDEKSAATVRENEEKLDMYEDKIGNYLVKLSSKDLSSKASKDVAELLHIIGDFERIGDHAVNILEVAEEIREKEIQFSSEANKEFDILTHAIREILNLATTAFEKNDQELAVKVEPLEEVIDGLTNELKKRHIDRLQQGKCTIQLGFVLTELLNNYERVSDHCSNIAVCVLQNKDDTFDSHQYLKEIKESGEAQFVTEYENYREQYKLPQ